MPNTKPRKAKRNVRTPQKTRIGFWLNSWMFGARIAGMNPAKPTAREIIPSLLGLEETVRDLIAKIQAAQAKTRGITKMSGVMARSSRA